jgi:hypothetical protein
METELKTEVATVTLSHRQTVASTYQVASGRIKVTCNGGTTKYYPYKATMEPAENHAHAIQQFLNLMEWEGVWTIGTSQDLRGYVAVWTGHKG